MELTAEDWAEIREIADIGIGSLGESYDIGRDRLLAVLAHVDQLEADRHILKDRFSMKVAQQDAMMVELAQLRSAKSRFEAATKESPFCWPYRQCHYCGVYKSDVADRLDTHEDGCPARGSEEATRVEYMEEQCLTEEDMKR